MTKVLNYDLIKEWEDLGGNNFFFSLEVVVTEIWVVGMGANFFRYLGSRYSFWLHSGTYKYFLIFIFCFARWYVLVFVRLQGPTDCEYELNLRPHAPKKRYTTIEPNPEISGTYGYKSSSPEVMDYRLSGSFCEFNYQIIFENTFSNKFK